MTILQFLSILILPPPVNIYISSVLQHKLYNSICEQEKVKVGRDWRDGDC